MTDLIFSEEQARLSLVLQTLRDLIHTETQRFALRRSDMVAANKDMWENTAHSSNDFNRMNEISQHLQQMQALASSYDKTKKQLERYEQMLPSPYFGRLDFLEDGESRPEAMYIGRGSVSDPRTREILVYDWRAPVSGMFYRFDPGPVWFEAPGGRIAGQMTTKRQLRIENGALTQWFDCSVESREEVLLDALSRNTSPRMRNIVETISGEQDRIIRDTDHDLLIVQGVAGSGKTSIALHRVAYLMYEGLTRQLAARNILILSPNQAFSTYISQVLPELGEENAARATMAAVVADIAEPLTARHPHWHCEWRHGQLERCVSRAAAAAVVAAKGSVSFRTLLDRYLTHYLRRLHPLEDIYYHGVHLMTRDAQRAMLLSQPADIPPAGRLSRIEARITDMAEPLRQKRLVQIQKLLSTGSRLHLNEKSASRALLMKDNQVLRSRLRRLTHLDPAHIYRRLFADDALWERMARGLNLEALTPELRRDTLKKLEKGRPSYEDMTAMAYLQLRLYGRQSQDNIQQVVVDEAQDYYPLQYALLHLRYPHARFTVVGDIAQSLERPGSLSVYDALPDILRAPRTVKLFLNKSFRSSYEITRFAGRFCALDQHADPFPRHEKTPEVLCCATENQRDENLLALAQRSLDEGFGTVAILCRTLKDARQLHARLSPHMPLRLVEGEEEPPESGCMVLPVYASKGLEFDVVLVADASRRYYHTDTDRRLLYVACTRPLHRLTLLYTGEKSPWLDEGDASPTVSHPG